MNFMMSPNKISEAMLFGVNLNNNLTFNHVFGENTKKKKCLRNNICNIKSMMLGMTIMD